MSKSESGKVSNAGNLYLIFLGVLLVAMGGFFMLIMGISYRNANLTRAWPEVSCKINHSERGSRTIPNRNTEYQWQGSYSYKMDGESYTSQRLEKRGAKWTTKVDKVDVIVEQFPVGSTKICFVNPEDKSYSILKHDSRGAGYSIWFPGLFAVGGLGMIFGAVKKWNRC